MSTPASTSSVFWAIVAIALGSASQQSFSGWGHSGQFFENTLWPHRTSPFICLSDILIEAICMLKSGENIFNRHNEQKVATPGARLMKLVIFVLGVLPQAVKLYSMEGIALTQVIASVYILSQISNALHGYCPPELDGEDQTKPVWTSRDYPRKFSSVSVDNLSLINMFIGFVLHTAALIWIWVKIGAKIHFDVPKDVQNAIDWARLFLLLLYVLYFSLQMSMAVLGRHIKRFRLPILSLLCFAPGLLTGTLSFALPRSQDPFGQGIRLLMMAAWSAYGIVVSLNFCVSKFPSAIAQGEAASTNHATNMPPLGHMDTSSASATAPSTLSTPRTMMTTSSTTPIPNDSARPSGRTSSPTHSDTFSTENSAQASRSNDGISASTHPPSVNANTERTASTLGLYVLRILGKVLYHTADVFYEGLAWYGRPFEKASHEVIWMTFGVLNFITAAVAYCILFDPVGTVSPSWNSILG